MSIGKNVLVFLILVSAIIIPRMAGAETGDLAIAPENTDTKIKISGTAAMENGQLINSIFQNRLQPNRPWISRSYGRLRLSGKVNEHLTIIIAPEVKLWYDTYTWQTMGNEAFKYPFNQHSEISLTEAQGILQYTFSNNIHFNFAAGVIPYKYNDEVKNLGEYLFRTGAKPAYITTNFDYAYARLAGLRLNTILFDRLSADFFMTSQTEVLPTRDWSPSFLLKYSDTSLYSIGAGVMWDHLFPVDQSLTTPKLTTFNRYYTEQGEEKYMSFGGTKLVGNVLFDPKGLLPSSISRIFGKSDGKIYAEIAVLGTQSFNAYMHPNDPNTGLPDTTRVVLDSSKNYYSDIKQRIPVMFGFNIPTFKTMDYLSTEFEWYGWPYPNSTGYVVEFRSLNPQPTPDKVNSDRTYELDNWKYSLNFKKSVTKGFSILGQLSRDHTRHDIYYKGYIDLSEALVFTDRIENLGDILNTSKWGGFGWWLKLQYTL